MACFVIRYLLAAWLLLWAITTTTFAQTKDSFATSFPATREYLRNIPEDSQRAVIAEIYLQLKTELVRGRGLGRQENRIPFAERKNVKEALEKAVDVAGIELIPAVLTDSPDDDIVRQAAYSVLINHSDLTLAHLPMLSRIYVTLRTDEHLPVPYGDRSWLSTSSARTRLAQNIANLCGLNAGEFFADGPISLPSQMRDPDRWLVDFLETILSREFVEEQRSHVVNALAIAKEGIESYGTKEGPQ